MTLYRLQLVLVVGLGVSGCKNLCDRGSPCPADTQPSAASRDQCNANLQRIAGSPCSNEVIASTSCSLDNLLCGADGHADLVASASRIQTNCAAAQKAVSDCCVANRTSKACGGAG